MKSIRHYQEYLVNNNCERWENPVSRFLTQRYKKSKKKKKIKNTVYIFKNIYVSKILIFRIFYLRRKRSFLEYVKKFFEKSEKEVKDGHKANLSPQFSAKLPKNKKRGLRPLP